jgi:hypothetical protein
LSLIEAPQSLVHPRISVSRLVLWRGEEEGPNTKGDPKQELVRKLTWTYGNLPYFLGYYANAAVVTYCALVHDAKQYKTEVVDLITINLSIPEDRLLASLIGFNMSKLLMRLSEAGIVLRVESDFYHYCTDRKIVSMELVLTRSTKIRIPSRRCTKYMRASRIALMQTRCRKLTKLIVDSK